MVQARATYESVTVPGARAAALGTTHLYVTHVRLVREGRYWLLVRPLGEAAIHALAKIVVKGHSTSLPVGAHAPATANPTFASSLGDLAAITTHAPPDRALLTYSIGGSLAARRPFVVVFAIPKLCLNRACGPIVDVVDAGRRRFAGGGVRFIHVEPFRGNDPSRGLNRYARQWRIPTAPFTFLVDRDGRIRAKFEGSFSPEELTAAIRAKLLR